MLTVEQLQVLQPETKVNYCFYSNVFYMGQQGDTVLLHDKSGTVKPVLTGLFLKHASLAQ